MFDGIKFDSKKESQYYAILKVLEKAGKIRDLKLQVPFVLIETFKVDDRTYRKTKYIADFTYYDDKDKLHVIDVKGVHTNEYQLKKKLMAWKYGIEIEEVQCDTNRYRAVKHNNKYYLLIEYRDIDTKKIEVKGKKNVMTYIRENGLVKYDSDKELQKKKEDEVRKELEACSWWIE